MGKMVNLSAIRMEIAAGANPENYDDKPSNYEQGCIAACENLLYILDHNIPAVDAEPVVHAHWIPDPVGSCPFSCDDDIINHYKCSRCGRRVAHRADQNLFERFPYCNCGAKMDEEAQNG